MFGEVFLNGNDCSSAQVPEGSTRRPPGTRQPGLPRRVRGRGGLRAPGGRGPGLGKQRKRPAARRRAASRRLVSKHNKLFPHPLPSVPPPPHCGSSSLEVQCDRLPCVLNTSTRVSQPASIFQLHWCLVSLILFPSPPLVVSFCTYPACLLAFNGPECSRTLLTGHLSSQEVEGRACSPPLTSIPLTMREEETKRAGKGVETQVNLNAKGALCCVP